MMNVYSPMPAVKKTKLPWIEMTNYGEIENHIYMIFSKKRTVVMDLKQLKTSDYQKIMKFLKDVNPKEQ